MERSLSKAGIQCVRRIGRSRWLRVAAVLPVLATVALTPARPTAASLIGPIGGSCDTCQQASFTLDNVAVNVTTPFLPVPTFDTSQSGDAQQVASSMDVQPYRELFITAVPFGYATEYIGVSSAAQAGGASTYRSEIQNYEASQGAQTQVTGPTQIAGESGYASNPIATLFGQSVEGHVSQMNFAGSNVDPGPTLFVEWVVEAGPRLWIARATKELPSGEDMYSANSQAFIQSLNNLVLSSDTLSNSTSLSSGSAGAPTELAQADSPSGNIPSASWWDGDCDYNHYRAVAGRGSYRLGAVYRGMPACGPSPIADRGPDVLVRFYPNAWGEYEWECVERSMRFMYLAYGVRPYQANGDQVVWNYKTTYGGGLQKVVNGASGALPRPGDVISFRYMHTSVVTSTSVNLNGNGSITTIEQNSSANGIKVISVSGWKVGGSVAGWLHKP